MIHTYDESRAPTAPTSAGLIIMPLSYTIPKKSFFGILDRYRSQIKNYPAYLFELRAARRIADKGTRRPRIVIIF